VEILQATDSIMDSTRTHRKHVLNSGKPRRNWSSEDISKHRVGLTFTTNGCACVHKRNVAGRGAKGRNTPPIFFLPKKFFFATELKKGQINIQRCSKQLSGWCTHRKKWTCILRDTQ